MTDNQARIAKLKKLIKDLNLDGVFVPRADEWLGEFVAPYAERLKWLTGFSGSAGTALILIDRLVIFTDPRYTAQAATQCPDFDVVDITKEPIHEWIKNNISPGMRFGFDPWLHTDEQCQKIVEAGYELAAMEENAVDQIWDHQPEKPKTAIHNFPDDIAGDTHTEKCNQISWMIKEIGVRWYILTQPDSIAWLLNIRAADTDFIPVALSYLLLGENGEIIWFIDPERISEDVAEKLAHQAKFVKPDDTTEMLSALIDANRDTSFGIDFKRSPVWFKYHFAEQGKEIIDIKDPCLFPKSLKTLQEQEAIKQAHIDDGVAVTRFLKWFAEDGVGETEISITDKLEEFRSLSPKYCGPSFPTIAGFGANGAVIHYRADDHTNTTIEEGGLILLDSGGQYHYGTTDITRTIAVGELSDEMKENYTRVLQGHIAVADAKFSDGTTGKDIDALARKPLQDAGLDFAHGTGHGVGCFLAVHEYAANLSPRGEDELKPGMLLSNEPGYYKEDNYGIRLENLILCQFEEGQDVQDILEKSKDSAVDYIFESVTFAPFDPVLIVPEMLSEDEKAWLNDYHKTVFETLSPYLDKPTTKWLAEQTAPIK
ncbi:MAG: aminopeptidase P family protein [Pseudomonadota bacterium]